MIFALIAPDEYDVLLACNRKTEAIVAMREMWRRDRRERRESGGGSGGGDDELRVTASERFTYRASATRVRRVEFARVEGGDVDVDVYDIDADGASLADDESDEDED